MISLLAALGANYSSKVVTEVRRSSYRVEVRHFQRTLSLNGFFGNPYCICLWRPNLTTLLRQCRAYKQLWYATTQTDMKLTSSIIRHVAL
jgi:hypothetical protein